MLRTTIVVPTYWSWPRGEPGLPEDAIFDHPTPVDEGGTLARCLDSLKALTPSGFEALVISATVNPRLDEAVEDKLEAILRPYRSFFPVAQFGPSDLRRVRAALEGRGIDPTLVSLEAYAQIRNCQILGSVLLGSELIVAVDDDEVVPPDFLDKALQPMDRTAVAGLAGVYLDARGDYRLRVSAEEAASGNKFVRKAALINEQFDACFAQPSRLVETPVALGGNMVFPEELFRGVAFDPGITRGEDIDYLMNSHLFGYRWLMDKELVITHLPPGRSDGDPVTSTPYGKLQRDVLRFVYQREKIRVSRTLPGVHALSAEEFGVYPGEFLKEDLEAQALEALHRMRPADADERFFPAPEALLEQAGERAELAAQYPAFNDRWREILDVAGRDHRLKESLRRNLE